VNIRLEEKGGRVRLTNRHGTAIFVRDEKEKVYLI
jgi:hypothetical protein